MSSIKTFTPSAIPVFPEYRVTHQASDSIDGVFAEYFTSSVCGLPCHGIHYLDRKELEIRVGDRTMLIKL